MKHESLLKLSARGALLALGVATLASTAWSQRFGGTRETYWSLGGAQPDAATGFSVIGIPDVDGDGVPEVVVGSPYADTMTYTDNGLVSCYSGATGTLLWEHHGRSDYEARSFSMADAGDWNGDGISDVVVGSPFYDPLPDVDAGLVKVLDAVTGVDIFTLRGVTSGDYFGTDVSGGYDYDGDGRSDLLVGAPGGDYNGADSGRAYVYSGATGSVLMSFDGYAAGDSCGSAVDWVGDIDKDGLGEFIVGSPNASPFGRYQAGQMIVVDGSTGTFRVRYDGINTGGHLGHDVVGGGDFDGDGIPDYGFSAPDARVGMNPSAGRFNVHAGGGGSQLYAFLGDNELDRLGETIAFADDLNGDSYVEIMVAGRGRFNRGYVEIYDGLYGDLLQRFEGAVPGDLFGSALASIGDLDGSGEVAIAIGASGATAAGLPGAGSLRTLTFSEGMTSTSATVSASAGGSVDFLIDFPAHESGEIYALLGSGVGEGRETTYNVTVPLVADTFFARFIGGTPPPEFSSVYGILDLDGDAVVNVTLPPGAPLSLVGRTFWFSGVSYEPPATVRVASVAVPLTVVL